MKEKIKLWLAELIVVFKNHWMACLLAILVGAASVAPHFLAYRSLGADYRGFPFIPQANEDFYLTRIQEVVDGHWLVSGPYLFEYKNRLPIVFPIGELLYALPTLLFGVSVVSVLMATKFIFPALLFLLVYILLYNLSNHERYDKITSSFGGLFVTLGYYFINFKNVWLILTGQKAEFVTSVWTRPVNPITGAVFLFIFLIFFWKGANSKSRLYLAVSGFAFGLMTGYVFSWLVALAFMGAVGIFSLLRRRLEIIKKLIFVVLCSILTAAPALYFWFYSLFISTDGQYEASRTGLLFTHQPIVNKMVLMQTVIFLPLFLIERHRRKKSSEKIEEQWWFMAALVFGGWLVYNQQIITGREIWPPHLTQYTIPMAYITSVFALGNYFKGRAPKLWYFFIIIITGLVALYTVRTTLNYRVMMPDFAAAQRFMPFLTWLDYNAPKDCVVLVKEEYQQGETEFLTKSIPALTPCNVYAIDYAFAPPERLYHSYLMKLRLHGVKEKGLEQYLWDHKDTVRFYFNTNWSQWLDSDESWLSEPIRKIVADYHDFLKQDFSTVLQRYKIDYLASEEKLDDQFPRARLLGQFGTVYIYKF